MKIISGIGISNDYYSLIDSQYIQDKYNLKYKFILIKKISSMSNKYFPNYKKEIKILNCNNINKINSIEDFDKYSEYKNITINDFFVSTIEMLFIDSIQIENKHKYEKYQELINDIFTTYNDLINQLFSNPNSNQNQNSKLNKIIFLLKNINLYSFGIVFIEWIYKNINSSDDITLNKDIIEKMFDIIILSCTNYIVIDSILFLSIPNLNIENLNFFFTNTI
jgi:hypothetical protein